MNAPSTSLALLAQAAAVAAPAATAEQPWWRSPGAGWLITLGVLLAATLVAWLIAKALKVPDMWGRIAVVLVSLAAGGVICWLGWPPRLGIDLKGGLILVYEVDPGREAEARVEGCIDALERLAKAQGIAGVGVERRSDRLVALRLTGEAAVREAFLAAVKSTRFDQAEVRERSRQGRDDELVVAYEIVPQAESVPMSDLVAKISKRVNPGGQKEVTVRQLGVDQIEVILPEVAQEEVELVKRVISTAGKLEFRILVNRNDARPEHREAIRLAEASRARTVRRDGKEIARWVRLLPEKVSLEPDMITRKGADDGPEVLMLVEDPDVTVTGDDLVIPVRAGFDESSLQPCVEFALKSDGAVEFGRLTSRNRPDPTSGLMSRLGIVLDDVLQSAPVIREAISSNGQISGNFDQADVDFLVEVLNAGSLKVALRREPVSEQQISAQLGDDTIRSASRAMLLATIIVLSFMLAYYRFSGLVADLAVLLNIVLVVALMITFKAAFTLAGLAGLVLSIGMAVDANVLIYERMREELDRGATVRMAIRNGFQRAFSTIIDSNLTTLITGIVLFAIGTDQLKGFAVTLILGLALNLFTAVFCARVVFDLAERSRWLRTLSMARLLSQPNLRFVRWAWPAALASLVVIALGGVAAARRGQELFDIDFTGGTSVQVEFKEGQELPIAEVRRLVSGKLASATVSGIAPAGGATGTRFKIDTSNQDEREVERLLEEAFPGRLATYSVRIGGVEPIADAVAEGTTVGGEVVKLATAVPLTFPEKIAGPVLQAKLAEALAAAGIDDAAFDLQSADPGADSGRPCRDWALSTSLDADATRRVLGRLESAIAGTPVYLSVNAIGGKVAGNTQWTAVSALLASLGLIVLYVWIRFQNVAFGVAAVVALVHDVLVALAFLAASSYLAPVLGWALVDEFRISLDVVAALLTIVGFSINDTIVIFDRLRELRGKARFVTPEMVDRAVNQTLSRTILTSGTTLLAVLLLYAAGGPGIHAFAFTMLVGVISGTYSTIYVAAPLVLWLQHRFGSAAVSERAVAQPA